MRMTVPKTSGNECSLCKEDLSFFEDSHTIEDCFEAMRERVEALETIHLSLLTRVTILESTEARNRNA